MAASLTYGRQTAARWLGYTRDILGRRKVLNRSQWAACRSRVEASAEAGASSPGRGAGPSPSSVSPSATASMISERLDSFTRFSSRPEKCRWAVLERSVGSLSPMPLTRAPSICPLVGSCGETSASIVAPAISPGPVGFTSPIIQAVPGEELPRVH